jgi:predicted ester cyclase
LGAAAGGRGRSSAPCGFENGASTTLPRCAAGAINETFAAHHIEESVMALAGTELVQTWFEEVWNKGHAEAIDRYAAPDWVGHGTALPGTSDQSRLERFKLLYHTYRTAFPDIRFTVERTITEGDFIAAHLSVHGTHTGEGLRFAPTGRRVQFSGTIIIRRAGDQVSESWENWSLLDIYEQLGHSRA